MCSIDLQLSWKQLHERRRDLDADAHWSHRRAIGDDDENAAAVLTAERRGRTGLAIS